MKADENATMHKSDVENEFELDFKPFYVRWASSDNSQNLKTW